MTVMCSPNEIFKAAKDMLLDGREPESKIEWFSIMAFFAANIDKPVRLSACKLIRLIYEMPLDEEQVEFIVNIQR